MAKKRDKICVEYRLALVIYLYVCYMWKGHDPAVHLDHPVLGRYH